MKGSRRRLWRASSINIEVGTVVPVIDDPEVCKYAYFLLVRIVAESIDCVECVSYVDVDAV